MYSEEDNDFVAPPSPEVGSSSDFASPPPLEVGDVQPSDIDFDASQTPPTEKKPFPWKRIVLIGGIVIAVGLIVMGVLLIVSKVSETPLQKIVADYYAAWEAKDFSAMSAMQDPTSRINAAKIADYLVSGLKKIFGDVNIDINWQFSNLTYKVLSNDHQRAVVLVTGEIRFTAFGLVDVNRPYEATHELIKINKQWYIKP